MLRRVKADVEIAIPPKAERIIHASLTQLQQKYYQAIMNDRLRDVLDASSVDKLRCQGSDVPLWFGSVNASPNRSSGYHY